MTNQRELRLQGKDPATLRAHGIIARTPYKRFSDTILFGGVPMLVEPKSNQCARCKGKGTGPAGLAVLPGNRCVDCKGTGKRISPEVAKHQRLTYQQIIDREA